MKNSKYLLLAAIAATTASLSSCSDKDVLEGAKDTGIPLTVSATTNSDGSRSTDITSLSNFQLWGFGIDDNRFDGYTFSKDGSIFKSAESSEPKWPGSDAYLFYGISDNTSSLAYGVAASSAGIHTTKAGVVDDGGKFTYTIPTNVADQKDLLVAAAKGTSASGVHMHFDHALTAAKLNFVLTPSLTEYGQATEHYMFVIKINKITIHNIKVSGTYSFGNGTAVSATSWTKAENGSWDTSNGTLGNCVIDLSSNPILIQTPYNVPANVAVNADGSDGFIYFIPQTISPWNVSGNTGFDISSPGNTDTENNLSYIELSASSMVFKYEALLAELEQHVNDGDIDGLGKDASGNYTYNGNVIVSSDGKVVDFACEILNDWTLSTATTSEVYSDDAFNDGEILNMFADINASSLGTVYKPFRATLDINGNRVLKVELTTGARATDASGTFGAGASVVGG